MEKDNVSRRQKELEEWSKPITPARYLELADGDGLAAATRVLVAGNQYGSTDQSARVILIDVGAKAPRNLGDRWLARKDIPDLAQVLSGQCEVLMGDCDAMFATGWVYAWSKGDDGFELWSNDGKVAEVGARDVHLLRKDGEAETIERSRIRAVAAYVSDCWCIREVRLLLDDDSHVAVAEVTDTWPKEDMMYDGFNLLADTSWVVDLAMTLARALEVPWENCTG